MESYFAIVIVLVLPSFLLILSILRRHLLLNPGSPAAGKLPPGPVPAPVVGSLFKLGDQPHRSLAVLAATYGPLMSLRLGQVTTVVVSSAAMAKEVLKKHDQSFAGRSVVEAARVLGHEKVSMVWLEPGQQWRRLRSLCNTSIFSSQRLDAGESLRRRKVAELLAHVKNRALSLKPVDIGKVAFVTVLNLISNTVFSVDMVDIDMDETQEFKDLIWEIMEEAGKPNLVDFFPILRPIDPQGIRRGMKTKLVKLHRVFGKQIDDREISRSTSKHQRRNDFLDALLDEENAELSRIELNALFTDLFVAGSDTSSVTVEWAMSELLRNPESMARARTELDEVMGERAEVEESDIPRLPYLQAVVKETLRLHPPVPFLIPHRAECDVEIAGYTLPKHTKVIVNAWAIGRDGEVWENPECFNPERFLGTSSNVDYRGRHFELIPFGAGRRVCPGLPLAYRMVHLMLASLLLSFSWKLPAGIVAHDLDMREKFGITLHKSTPLMAVPY
ncbi:hypothetical protein H6P81_017425 [Aristolochia fimbriata]|uniref:Cytochrome P450 n=1 Tax=Aristolochia fimbriata TaxID=158543 RepID=A0AAV7E180_ARIFI|nr:hypothetical protein H6P81_017425 [Aristolochia fimbriata]